MAMKKKKPVKKAPAKKKAVKKKAESKKADTTDTRDVKRYVEFFVPFVEILKEHEGAVKLSDMPGLLIEKMDVSKKEQKETMPNGGLKLHNRIAWVKKIMETAGLLAAGEGNVIKLTEAGLKTKVGEGQDVYDLLSLCSEELDKAEDQQQTMVVRQFLRYLSLYGFE